MHKLEESFNFVADAIWRFALNTRDLHIYVQARPQRILLAKISGIIGQWDMQFKH